MIVIKKVSIDLLLLAATLGSHPPRNSDSLLDMPIKQGLPRSGHGLLQGNCTPMIGAA
jgi:hypothetical protein